MNLYSLAVAAAALLTTTVLLAQSTDTDGDGVQDAMDNCLLVANASQTDTDGDSWGNACDSDFNNDGQVNFIDFSMLSQNFLSTEALYDLDDTGVVNFLDVALFMSVFQQPPGPAGFANSDGGSWCNPADWAPAAVPTDRTHVFLSTGANLFFKDCEAAGIPDSISSEFIEVASITALNGLTLTTLVEFDGPVHIVSDINVLSGDLTLTSAGGFPGPGDPLSIVGDVTVLDGNAFLSTVDVRVDGVVTLQSVIGSLELRDSALRNARVEPGQFGRITASELSFDGVVFDNITLAGVMDLALSFSGPAVSIENGITFDGGEILVGDSEFPLTFIGTQTLAGQGSINLTLGAEPTNTILLTPQSTLTIEAGIDVFTGLNIVVDASGSELILNGPFDAIGNVQITADRIEIGGELSVGSSDPDVFESRLETVVDVAPGGELNIGGLCCFSNSDDAVTVTGDLTNAGMINVFRSGLALTSRFENNGSVEVVEGTLSIGDEVDDVWEHTPGVASLSLSQSNLNVFATFDTNNLELFGSSISVSLSGKMLNADTFGVGYPGDTRYEPPLEVVGGVFPNVFGGDVTFVPTDADFVLNAVELTGTVDFGQDLNIVVRNGMTLRFESQFQAAGSVITFDGTQTLSANTGGGTFLWQSETPLDNDQLFVVAGTTPTLTVGEGVDWIVDVPTATLGSEGANITFESNLTFSPLVEAAEVKGDELSVLRRLIVQNEFGTQPGVVTINATSLTLASFAVERDTQLILNVDELTSFSFFGADSSVLDGGARVDINSPAIELFSDVRFNVGDFGAGVVNFLSLPAPFFVPTWEVAIESGYAPSTCNTFSIITHPTIDPVSNPFPISLGIFSPGPFGYFTSESFLPTSINVSVGPTGTNECD